MVIGVTYMRLAHFQHALTAFDDAIRLYDKSSQLFFRRSQALSYNRAATLEEL
jgi:cytochrome c-type biogenesis protein CcmH/NrfG